MEKKDKNSNNDKHIYKPPLGSITKHQYKSESGQSFSYKAHTDWIILCKNEKPVAEMFYIAYFKGASQSEKRPITFVFNGGPGAASAYLHLGAIGPKRINFNKDGTIPKSPIKLVENYESWLPFTDLVFIDPIGTGFSRVIHNSESNEKHNSKEKSEEKTQKEEEFYQLNRDLETLGEFIQRFLSNNNRWLSPIFIAGESYGGFRVAKLARKLQEEYGISLSGAILISPALEWYLLTGSDYDVLTWATAFPSMVAVAAHHGKYKNYSKNASLKQILREIEKFTTDELIPLLALGDGLEPNRKKMIIDKMSDYLGINPSFLKMRNGRLNPIAFVRELLKDQLLVCGLHDASITVPDPFPDRSVFVGPNPLLHGIDCFNMGINAHLRTNLNLDTERQYLFLNMNVNKSWKVDEKKHVFDSQIGGTDDLRFALALNPHMHVSVSHGYYDLVTPYFGSRRIIHLMKLTSEQKRRMQIDNFKGGHMFYTWAASRLAFTNAMKKFYKKALA